MVGLDGAGKTCILKSKLNRLAIALYIFFLYPDLYYGVVLNSIIALLYKFSLGKPIVTVPTIGFNSEEGIFKIFVS